MILILVGATNTSTIQQENTIRSAQSPQPQQQESVRGVKKNENNLKASRNITLMIIFQCVLSTIGNFFLYILYTNILSIINYLFKKDMDHLCCHTYLALY